MDTRTLVNGEIAAALPADDRGLHYGDGVFTTVRIRAGRPLLLEQHLQRLERDAQRLGFVAPASALLSSEAGALSEGISYGVLKIVLTRGSAERGYRPPVDAQPRRILQAISVVSDTARDAAEKGIAIRVCRIRLGRNPALAGVKHLNRLEQVLARAEWHDPAIAEGLMLDDHGHVVEATQANVFFVREQIVCTPALDNCGVQGVLRDQVLEQIEAWGMKIRIEHFMLDELLSADEVFLTNCLIGIVPVRRLEEKSWNTGSLSRQLQNALSECY